MTSWLLIALAAGCASATSTPTQPRPDPIAEAQVHERQGAFAAAREVLVRALEQARDDRRVALTTELARVWSHEAFARNRGYVEGLAAARAAQTAARAGRDPRALAIALDAEGMLHYGTLVWAGGTDFTRPRRDFEAAIAAYRDADDRSGLAEATFHLGLSNEQAGDTAAATGHYEQAHALAAQAGDDVIASYTERHLAGLAEARGDLVAARRGFQRSLELRERVGYRRLIPYALMALADLDLREGHTPRALATYQRALAMSEQIGNEGMLVWAHVGLGEVLHRSGAGAEALRHFERALEIAERSGIAIAIAAAARAAAGVSEELGDPQRASALRDRATRAEADGRAVTLK